MWKFGRNLKFGEQNFKFRNVVDGFCKLRTPRVTYSRIAMTNATMAIIVTSTHALTSYFAYKQQLLPVSLDYSSLLFLEYSRPGLRQTV